MTDKPAVVAVHREHGTEVQNIFVCELPAHADRAKAELAKLGDGDVTVVRLPPQPHHYSCKGCDAGWPEQ